MKNKLDKAEAAPAQVGSKYQTEDGRLLHPLTDEQIAALNSYSAVLEALRECITNGGENCLAYGTDTPALRHRLSNINAIARAALAQAEKGEA